MNHRAAESEGQLWVETRRSWMIGRRRIRQPAAVKTSDGFFQASPFKGLGVAKVKFKKNPKNTIGQSEQRRRFHRAGPPPTQWCAELLPVLPYDRGGRFQSNPNGATLVDKGALGGDPPYDILRGQYRRHPTTTLKRSRVRS
jgi:hypothetical protein